MASRKSRSNRHADLPGDPENIHPASVLERDGLSGNLAVEAPGGIVRLTHLDKVYWPDKGYTKGDLIRYYHQVASYLLPYLQDRPLILKRFPNCINNSSFFQHEAGEVPDFVCTAPIESEEGRVIDYIVCNNEATLLYLANLGAIDRHPWHSRLDDLDHPDWVVFDLDPAPEIPFAQVCTLTRAVRDVLQNLGLSAYAKTSGSTGMHVYVPIARRYPYSVIAGWAEQVARAAAARYPRLATLERSLSRRESSRIYVDHLQNARGKSVAAPYSIRPKPGATVSTPLTWEEVEHGVDPDTFSLRTIPNRLSERGDLFRSVLDEGQRLERAFEVPLPP